MPARAPYPVHNANEELFDYIERRIMFARHQALWLGGAPGSSGSILPPGSFIGCLPQNRVNWDEEYEYWSGGSTLVDNLSRIRKRLTEYMKLLAEPYSGGSGISAGSFPTWGSGAAIVGFSPGSPPGQTTVQGAIEYLYNEGMVGASKTFLNLTDTPSTYAGSSKKVVKVNVAENALEFGDAVGAGNKIILYHTDGNVAVEYDADGAGFDSAGSAAVAGDTIWLPSFAVASNHTLVSGVHYVGVSRWGSKLTGQITMTADATLERLTIERTANDGNDLVGVLGPATGTAMLSDCKVSCVQSGAGHSYGAKAGAGHVEFWNCDLYGESSAGSGYGGYRASVLDGSLYVYGGRARGSTASFNG